MERIMYRAGSIGIVIDDYTLNFAETAIEFFTGDGKHTFCIHDNNTITEALVKEGVIWGTLDKYLDGKSKCLICEPSARYFSDKFIQQVCTKWREDIGLKYDKLNILGKIFRNSRVLNSTERRICSEHTASGYFPKHLFLEKIPAAVSPNDILRDVMYTNKKYFNCDILGRKK